MQMDIGTVYCCLWFVCPEVIRQRDARVCVPYGLEAYVNCQLSTVNCQLSRRPGVRPLRAGFFHVGVPWLAGRPVCVPYGLEAIVNCQLSIVNCQDARVCVPYGMVFSRWRSLAGGTPGVRPLRAGSIFHFLLVLVGWYLLL